MRARSKVSLVVLVSTFVFLNSSPLARPIRYSGMSSAWAGEPAGLKASYAAISGNFAPIWVAQDKGLFAKYGLAVDLNFVPPSTATQSLIGKSLDIIAPGGEIVEAGLAGEKVAYIAAIANRVVLSLYGKREIQGLAGLKGRVLAVLTPGGTSDFLARILAQEAGLTPGKDIRILYMKSAPEILAALTQGNADAGIISAPMTLRARQLGFKEIVDVVGKNIPMVHSSLATTRDFVGDHRDRVRRFLQGYIEGCPRQSGGNQADRGQVHKNHRPGKSGGNLQNLCGRLGKGSLCLFSCRANDTQFFHQPQR